MHTEKIKARYEFTEDEKDQMARTMAAKQNTFNELELELHLFKSKMKQRMDPIQEDINSLCQKVNSGFETREYNCRVEVDYQESVVTYRDTETEKIIESRKLSPEERQREMF